MKSNSMCSIVLDLKLGKKKTYLPNPILNEMSETEYQTVWWERIKIENFIDFVYEQSKYYYRVFS